MSSDSLVTRRTFYTAYSSPTAATKDVPPRQRSIASVLRFVGIVVVLSLIVGMGVTQFSSTARAELRLVLSPSEDGSTAAAEPVELPLDGNATASSGGVLAAAADKARTRSKDSTTQVRRRSSRTRTAPGSSGSPSAPVAAEPQVKQQKGGVVKPRLGTAKPKGSKGGGAAAPSRTSLPLPVSRPSLARNVAMGILAYDPVIASNNNLGDWYQSGAALFAWWTYLTAAPQRPRTGQSRLMKPKKDSYFSLVSHAISEDAAGGGNSSSSSQWPRVVWMERDTLPLETRPPGVSAVILIMNGWWMQRRVKDEATGKPSFGYPLPTWVIPIFISFHISDQSMLNQPSVVEYLKANAPIGARDESTRDLLLAKGVDSYFSGCITPLLRLEDEGCAGFDSGVSSKDSCAVDAKWIENGAKHKQNPSNVLMTRNASWLRVTLNKYCSVFRWCSDIHTTRLHVWFPLHMNGYGATLYNKYEKAPVPVPHADDAVHPGVAIDGRRTNRFAGLLEAAAGDHQAYIDRIMRDVQNRIAAAVQKANAFAKATPT